MGRGTGFAPRTAWAPMVVVAVVMALGAGLVAHAAGPDVLRISRDGEREILRKPLHEVTGAGADVVVVEYFDYNCGFCKRFAPTLQAALAKDSKVTVVYKDWPILGSTSAYAARAALAADWQGKYLPAHDALLGAGHLSGPPQVDAILLGAGVDPVRMKKDLAAHSTDIDAALARVDAEARALELQGTPGILVGRQLVPGITDASGLTQLIAAARLAK